MADTPIKPSEIYRNITREGMLRYLARHGWHAVGFDYISTAGTMYVEADIGDEDYDDSSWIWEWPFGLRSVSPLIIVERNR